MAQANFGVVGMAVMGKNLALNVESRGYTVAIYNRTTSKTEEVYKEHQDKNLVFTKHLKNLSEVLKNHVVSCSWFKRELLLMQPSNHSYHFWTKATS